MLLHADSENSDQTGRMPRLIRVFAGRTCHFVGFVMRKLIIIVISSGLDQWLIHVERSLRQVSMDFVFHSSQFNLIYHNIFSLNYM